MPPTRREIQAELGQKSPSATQQHIKILVESGLIEIGPKKTHRNIRVTRRGFIALSVYPDR